MISFKEFSPDDRVVLAEQMLSLMPEADAEDVESVICTCVDMLEDNPDLELGVCCEHGCVLIRVFELGRYGFVYPIPMLDEADEESALESLRAYAVKEEVPFRLLDVPRDALALVVSGFRHTTVDADDPMGECFVVTVQSEAMLIDEPPVVSAGAVSLSPLLDEHIADYARLCRDRAVNRYWGYDYRADEPDAEDGYFIRSARLEQSRGVAISFAATERHVFVGEAVLYAFDLRGGAEIAFRILPEWQGMGLGAATLEALIEAGRRMGLIRLYATVHGDNLPSSKLLDHYATAEHREDGTLRYRIELI